MVFPSERFRDDSSQSTGLAFIRVYNSWYGQLQQALRSVALTLPQFVILTVTAYLQSHAEYVTQTMIASGAHIDVMTTSQILRLLEKKELISRAVHPQDCRAKTVRLTAAGLNSVSRALPLVEEIDENFFGALGEGEVVFRALLQRLQPD